jgi:hypothetical protein
VSGRCPKISGNVRSVGRSFGRSFVCVKMTSETHGLVDALLYFDRGYDEPGVKDMCDALDASRCVWMSVDASRCVEMRFNASLRCVYN